MLKRLALEVKQISTEYRLRLAECILLINQWTRDGSSPELILVANKCEGAEGGRGHAAAEIAEAVAEGWQTGLGEPCAISAEHGGGLSDLYVVRYTIYPPSLPRS